MLPEDLRRTIDQWFTAQVSPKLSSRQSAYLQDNEFYWQGLPTHSVLPDHDDRGTRNREPDKMTRKPTDGVQTWFDFLPELDSQKLPVSFTVNTYVGPSGKGYECVLVCMFKGTTYSRTVNFGPETYRESDWQKVSDELL